MTKSKIFQVLSPILTAVLVGSAGLLLLLRIATNTKPTLASPNQAPSSQYTTRPLFWRFLDTNGDGTGTKIITGNYTTTTPIYLRAPTGTVYVVSRLLVEIEDTGVISPETYGSTTGLITGIVIRMRDISGPVITFTDNVNIKTNANYGRFCSISQTAFGSGSNFLRVDCDLAKTGSLLRLNGDKGERLEVLVFDDFSGLTGHYFVAQGFTE